MVNIHIHQFQPAGAVIDQAALEQFLRRPATYQKLVDADQLSHKAVGAPCTTPSSRRLTWCSLSIHHLDTASKLRLMRAIRNATGTLLMLYEPTRNDGETRDQYLQRFRRVNQPRWTMLAPDEWAQILPSRHHRRPSRDATRMARPRP